jgi:hypothetical protein
MKYLFIILGFMISSIGQCQPTYQILFEGEYPIDSDSSLYKTLDWYGFYTKDSVNKNDEYEKVDLKIKYLSDYKGFLYKTPPSIISTSNSRRSLFLLGIQKGKKLDFNSEYRCGRTDQYTYQETSLLPGRWVNWHSPTMSCTNLSIYAMGAVKKDGKSYELIEYRIFTELNSGLDGKSKTQEITKDLFTDSKALIMHPFGTVPYIYSTGDFDLDAKTDFILKHDGTFYLYLTKFATGDENVRLQAKTKLKILTDIGFTSTTNK